MGNHYHIICKNNSSASGSFCIFQHFKEQETTIHSLVWLCKFCHPQVSVNFDWNDELYFIWGELSNLEPNQTFFVSQTEKAAVDVEGKNAVGLTWLKDGGMFKETPYSPNKGTLGIYADETIPLATIAAGIGMHGKNYCGIGTIISQVYPNMSNIFSCEIEYGICFGDFKLGQIINLKNLPNYFPFSITPSEPSLCIEWTKSHTWNLTTLT